MTGGRIKRLKNYIGNQSFFLTYGDGVADIDLRALLEFHKRHGKMVTVTAVHPAARFGNLNLTGEQVSGFSEKVQTKHRKVKKMERETTFLDQSISNDRGSLTFICLVSFCTRMRTMLI